MGLSILIERPDVPGRWRSRLDRPNGEIYAKVLDAEGNPADDWDPTADSRLTATYNALVQSWPEITRLAGSPEQPRLL